MKWVLRVAQEPLLHFLILAAGLFGAAHLWGEPQPTSEKETIVVGPAKIRHLASLWQRTWQRPPSQAELQGLIEEYIYEEVLYREALKMNWDRDDSVIRRRLRQKMEFVVEDQVDTIEPDDQELRQFLQEHQEAFRGDRSATFRQIPFQSSRRGESLQQDVTAVLETLRHGGDSPDTAELGDPLLLLPHQLRKVSERKIASQFGRQFLSGLLSAEKGQWTGPIPSGYGVHLIFLEELSEGELPELSEIRDAVLRSWRAQRRAAAKKESYQALRRQYEVVVQMPEEPKQ